jgi:hypothetical protein
MFLRNIGFSLRTERRFNAEDHILLAVNKLKT